MSDQSELSRILVNAGSIRKITIGDIFNGMKYTVESEVGPKDSNGVRIGFITKIIYDQNSFYTSGVAKYLVYIRRYDDKDELDRIWKFFENQPVAVELFTDKD